MNNDEERIISEMASHLRYELMEIKEKLKSGEITINGESIDE